MCVGDLLGDLLGFDISNLLGYMEGPAIGNWLVPLENNKLGSGANNSTSFSKGNGVGL